MTEKLKVSQEVGDALKDLFSRSEFNYPKNEILEMHYQALNGGDKWCGGTWEHLNRLSMSEMAQAMFVGYEIETVFKVGDKVMVKWANHDCEISYEIVEVKGNQVEIARKDDFNIAPLDIIRHLTEAEIKIEQERQLWNSIGREVGEFKTGDLKVYKSGSVSRVGFPNVAKSSYELGALEGFYPLESFIKF